MFASRKSRQRHVEMSRDHEVQLRATIERFGAAWCDPAGRRNIELHDPVASTTLDEIENVLGSPLPPPVRIVLETFDGTARSGSEACSSSIDAKGGTTIS